MSVVRRRTIAATTSLNYGAVADNEGRRRLVMMVQGGSVLGGEGADGGDVMVEVNGEEGRRCG